MVKVKFKNPKYCSIWKHSRDTKTTVNAVILQNYYYSYLVIPSLQIDYLYAL